MSFLNQTENISTIISQNKIFCRNQFNQDLVN